MDREHSDGVRAELPIRAGGARATGGRVEKARGGEAEALEALILDLARSRHVEGPACSSVLRRAAGAC